MYGTIIILTILSLNNIIQGCDIDLDQRSGKYPPFILNGKGEPLYPVTDRILNVDEGEKVTVLCHGTEKRPNKVKISSLGLSGSNVASLDLECKNGAFYKGDKKITANKLNKVTCTRIMEPLIIREENSDCSNGLGADGREKAEKITFVKVGWSFNGHFDEQFQACIDEKVYGTLWTKHRVHGESIELRDKESGRPSFRTDTRGYKRFFDFTSATAVTRAYRKTNQVEVMKTLLNTNNLLPDGTKIIDDSTSGTNYFAKGHLSPDASFIEGAEQDATYFFFNVAPQFQSFNNGNWKALEFVTREMAAKHNGTVTVYTGTFGVLEYPNNEGESTPIFLMENNGERYIPAPKYYWKVLFNEVTKEAVGFIGLNDPHAEDIAPENAFCQTACASIKGVDWSVEEEAKGHMSCCTLQELSDKIGFMPEFQQGYKDDTDLLDDNNGANEPPTEPPFSDPNGCSINLDDRTGKYPPFILKENGEIAYPEGSRTLSFGNGESLSLFCHGTDLRVNALSMESLGLQSSEGSPKSLSLKCEDKAFLHQNGPIDVGNIYSATCTRIMEPLIVREESSDCSQGLGADGRTDDLESIVLVKVGWQFNGDFEEQFSACIDEKVYGTLWTHHTVLGKSIAFRDKESGRPSFRVDSRGYKRFFTFDTATRITDTYSKNSQVEVVKQLLGTDNQLPNGETIIDSSSSGTNYFAKGHLSPDAAFIEGAEQDGTYFFFNVAPQFQSFNNGNWKALEYATRDLAESSMDKVQVWTGTYGVLSYPDVNANEVDIFLYLEGDKKYIPAPKYYWKVLKDVAKNQAVAFVGLNDPHSDDISPNETLCQSVCDQITGIDWDIEEEGKGHMVCCTVQDLNQKIPFAPDLGDIDLVTNVDY